MAEHPLGRFEPTDFVHLEKYPFNRRRSTTVTTVNKTIALPYHYRRKIDQGVEGACVGASCTWHQSINNRQLYDLFWLYEEAKKIDEWAGEDYDGTSVRAGFDVLRHIGHRRIYYGRTLEPNLEHGIVTNRWALSVDEMRTAIAMNEPIVVGSNWYSGMDDPIQRGREFWMPEREIGFLRGGHAWTIYGASDRKQAFKMVNSWGMDYPLTWVPYMLMDRLLNEYGEAAVATDR